MKEKKMTDLERRLRWFYRVIADMIDLSDLEVILLADWNAERTKLVLEPDKFKSVGIDLLSWSKKHFPSDKSE